MPEHNKNEKKTASTQRWHNKTKGICESIEFRDIPSFELKPLYALQTITEGLDDGKENSLLADIVSRRVFFELQPQICARLNSIG